MPAEKQSNIPPTSFPKPAWKGLARLYGDGILVAGDAAGFALNTGITVRGMEFAIASGVLAARAIITATEKKDFSSQSLAEYERLLKESFVLKDMETFKKAPHFLDNPRLMGLLSSVCLRYPRKTDVYRRPAEEKAGRHGHRRSPQKD